MALAEVVSPYVDSPNDLRWVGPALAYRSRLQSALDGIDAASMQADWRANSAFRFTRVAGCPPKTRARCAVEP